MQVLCPADVIARIGEFIRSFCVSMGPSAGARGVALHNAELLAVSLAAGFTDGEPRVFLFDYQTAALIRSFGPRGVGPTEVGLHILACAQCVLMSFVSEVLVFTVKLPARSRLEYHAVQVEVPVHVLVSHDETGLTTGFVVHVFHSVVHVSFIISVCTQPTGGTLHRLPLHS